MIRVALLYPRTPETTFDATYYAERHVPFSRRVFTALGMVRSEWDLVLREARAETPSVYAISYQYWDSLDAVDAAFASEQVAAVRADTHHFYSGVPTVLVSEIHPTTPDNSSATEEEARI